MLFRSEIVKISLGGIRGKSLATVSSIMDLELTMSRNCFGLVLRLSGQNRVPLPPAMMTARMFMPSSLLMGNPGLVVVQALDDLFQNAAHFLLDGLEVGFRLPFEAEHQEGLGV